MNKTQYIYTLPEAIQDSIKLDLALTGLDQDDIEMALVSRLCDLEDTININKYL